MKNEVGKLAPLLEIRTMEGNFYYIERSREQEFLQKTKTEKFVKLGDEIIAMHQIIGIRPVMESAHMATLTLSQRRELALRIKTFEERLGRKPTDTEISNFTYKITNSQNEQ